MVDGVVAPVGEEQFSFRLPNGLKKLHCIGVDQLVLDDVPESVEDLFLAYVARAPAALPKGLKILSVHRVILHSQWVKNRHWLPSSLQELQLFA